MSILALLLAVQPSPQITSEPLDQNRYRLQASPVPAAIDGARAALLPAARRLCGQGPVRFGSFRYKQPDKSAADTRARPSPVSLDQEIFCGASRRAAVTPASLAPGWQPTSADQQAVLAAAYGYFAAKDGGRYAQAWAMLSDRLKAASPQLEWHRGVEAFNRRSGSVRARRVSEITWYSNPPEAAEPGLYVAADFSAEFEKLDFVCGYVMWRMQPDGSLVLTREEQNVFDRSRAKNLASIDREPLRAQMGCKD